MKKKIGALLLAACMIVCFGGCREKTLSPTETADKFLTALKGSDLETMQSLSDSDDFEILEELMRQKLEPKNSGEDLWDGPEEFKKSLMNSDLINDLKIKLLDFDYVLSNEKIDQDRATVDVAVTTYKIGDAIGSAMKKYVIYGLSRNVLGTSDHSLDVEFEKIFREELDQLTTKDYKANGTIELIRDGSGRWKVTDMKKESKLMNAILGGLGEFSRNMDTMFGD